MANCYSLKTWRWSGLIPNVDTNKIEAGNDDEAMGKAKSAIAEAKNKGLKMTGRLIKFEEGKDQPQILRYFN
jgi:hypothetical protein